MNKKKEKLFLHIGLPKTGTTSIQGALKENEGRLASYGLAYPKTFQASHMRHFHAYASYPQQRPRTQAALGEEIADQERFVRSFKQQVARAVSSSTALRMVYSNELLGNLHTRGIGRLQELFSEFFDAVEVVLYLRRQDTLELSAYLQAFKGGYEHREKFAEPFVTRRQSNRQVIERWASAFGMESIRVRIYERQRFPEGDVVRDFLQYLGISDSSDFEVPRAEKNSTYGLRQIAAARLLNPHFNRTSKVKTNAQRLHDPDVRDFILSLKSKRKYAPAREAAMRFYASHQQDNEWVRSRFFPDQLTLFDEDFSGYPEKGTPEQLSKAQLEKLIVELFRYHRRRSHKMGATKLSPRPSEGDQNRKKGGLASPVRRLARAWRARRGL